MASGNLSQPSAIRADASRGDGLLKVTWNALFANRTLTFGAFLVLAIVAFSIVGTIFIDPELTDVGAGKPAQPPSVEHPLGTDQQGRDVFADIVYGTPATLIIGLIAGLMGVGLGSLVGFTGGYFGGKWDTVVSLITDVFLAIPVLMVLIVVASLVDVLSIEAMGLLVGLLTWMGPARTIRAQALTLRTRAYVDVAKFNGVGNIEIIFKELTPTLLPYIAASLVQAVAAAILVSIGLSALGLGPQNEPSLGLTIFWGITYSALIRELWWWFGPPIVIIVVLFVGLFLITAGLDQISNPRIKTSS